MTGADLHNGIRGSSGKDFSELGEWPQSMLGDVAALGILLFKSLSLTEQFTTWCILRGQCALTPCFQRDSDSAELRDGWDMVRLHLGLEQGEPRANFTILGSPTMLRVVMCYFPLSFATTN